MIDLAIEEDVGQGDVTTQAIFDKGQEVRAHIVAKSPTVVCGVPLALNVLKRICPDAVLEHAASEGSVLETGEIICTFQADVRAILTTERIILNFLMHLCGVAANAKRAAEQLPPSIHVQILDTRKTVPGFRLLDKAAVQTGGASNHRIGLFDAFLIKDNHIAAAGSIEQAIKLAKQHASKNMLVEVEVDQLDQLEQAIKYGADMVLLDNFSVDDLRAAAKLANGRVLLEASGGVSYQDVALIAATGVHRISMGTITHTVKPADLSLEIL